MYFSFFFITLITFAWGQDTLETIEVLEDKTLEETHPNWEERDKTKILSGKKIGPAK
jgi:hypothetical protein